MTSPKSSTSLTPQQSCWSKTNAITQIVIGIALVTTVIITGVSICQQGEFNRNSLRPWIGVELDPNIQIEDGVFVFSYDTKCTGRTVAYRIKNYGSVSYSDVFPEDGFKKIKKKKGSVSFLVPNQTMRVEDKEVYIKMAVTPDIIDTIPVLRKRIIKLIENQEFFLHIYIEYEDFNANRYGLRYTALPAHLNEYKNKCDWLMIDSSDELIE